MTEQQAALVGKARRSVRAARLLADEGMHDFSASRSYYAMFYVAEAFLLGENLRFSKHSAVHAAFGKHFAKTGALPAAMHRRLIEAARIRNLGDYDMGAEIDSGAAETLIGHAEEFVRVAEERLGRSS